jgi:hypothetical protein
LTVDLYGFLFLPRDSQLLPGVSVITLMKNAVSYLLFLVLGFVSTAAIAQYSTIPENVQFRTEEQRYGHLKYFGFYASAMGGWNYTTELAPFTNLTWIHVGSGDDVAGGIELMLQRIRQARDAGVQATLSIESFLFSNAKGELRPEQQIIDFLVELRARLEVEELLDTVAMIYPKDEPYRNFIDARNPSFIDQYVTGKVYDEVFADLTLANETIRLVFPDKPIGVILSGYEVFNRFLLIPANYDWIGFDCYDNLFEACDDRSFVEHYRKLLDRMQPHQQLIAVPETWVQNEDMDQPDWPDVLQARLWQHYEMALNEPRFVAFIPFLWSFDASTEVPGLGLNRFPELFDDGLLDRGTEFVNAVKTIGVQVKTGQPVFPNLAWDDTEATIFRPPSNIRGEIMSITSRGVVSAWAFEDALPHKNLRVQVLVRDQSGKDIYKSRPERTFVHDPTLEGKDRIGEPFIGLPGYRLQLPQSVVEQGKTRRLTVELVIFEDGAEMSIATARQTSFGGGSRPPPGVKRWISSGLTGEGETVPDPPFPPIDQRDFYRATE